jgi:hypothetical protein
MAPRTGGDPVTATRLPAKPGQRRYPAPDYVECPVCHIPTGRITRTQGRGGSRVEPLPTSAGPDDPARCKRHARTPEHRAAQAAHAMDEIE